MPDFNVSVTLRTRGNTATFRLPDPTFGRTLIRAIGNAMADFRRYVREYAEKQVRNRLVPYLKSRLPRRTGRLRGSVRVVRVKDGFELLTAFYGAFQKPSEREIVRQWVQSNYRQILANAVRYAEGQIAT